MPGDDPAELDELKSAIFAELRPNRCQRLRLRKHTMIMAWRHPYGKKLADAGVRSETELYAIVRECKASNHKKLDQMAITLISIAELRATGSATQRPLKT